MLNKRKDLPQRRMPVIIFIIPLPSAEMSSFKYALRSKYIVYDVFLCQDTVFSRKYTFLHNFTKFYRNLHEIFKGI